MFLKAKKRQIISSDSPETKDLNSPTAKARRHTSATPDPDNLTIPELKFD